MRIFLSLKITEPKIWGHLKFRNALFYVVQKSLWVRKEQNMPVVDS